MDPRQESKAPELYDDIRYREFTAAGIPMDTSEVVSMFSMVNQPVYRSLAILNSEELAPSVVVLGQKLGKGDVRAPVESTSETEMYVPTPEKPKLVVVKSPPSVDSLMCPLERTHFEVSVELEELLVQLQNFCNAETIQFDLKDYELSCATYADDSFEYCEFRINLFSRENKIVVEFQRRSGDSLLFNRVFRTAKAHFHQCSSLLPQLGTRGLSLPIDIQPNPEEITEEWNCLMNWLENDPREAIRSIGALASQGATVPENVIAALVNLLTSEYRVEVLRTLTAAVPKSSLAGHDDQVFVAVSQSLNGGLLEQKQAWRFLAKAVSCLSNKRVDETTLNHALESKWPCIQRDANMYMLQ